MAYRGSFRSARQPTRVIAALLVLASLTGIVLMVHAQRASAAPPALPDPPPSTSRSAPAPAPPPGTSGKRAARQSAVLAGGCFWGVEDVFNHVRGVTSVTAGYAGGTRQSANYLAVSSERTGHAEAVRVIFDPVRISYGQLLKVFFAVAHDPTQVNRQTPDVGPSYRSAIFPQNPEQERIARAYIRRIEAAGVFARPLATRIENGTFYPAEAVHQDFARKNPTNGYIVRWDKPKVVALKTAFPALYSP
ncbi:peptide-methionine (S)-S-oxide reductase MsrA [Novosphingobium sp. 1949]|uniref:Peptide methionine sulfoxide reductase MsrA n=1 Tax=Novosphingobium organovorum TaxID=2930092 RepID=A0ABT0BHR8_9SPHN|nr:peptide-methionine (S)-S-oxide reductase MsrA [Novosphingobium organovorum]MCJ2184611.1 peptide-methionine (S)-S-oxide reductase MsrA [Novosphingobium organovorum]